MELLYFAAAASFMLLARVKFPFLLRNPLGGHFSRFKLKREFRALGNLKREFMPKGNLKLEKVAKGNLTRASRIKLAAAAK